MKTIDNTDPMAAIARSARRAPHSPAIIGEPCLSYGELHSRTQQIAGWIRGAGVGPDDVVGVLLPRGSTLLVALLGVLAGGGAYLPLDPATPPRRLAGLAGSARLRWIITDRSGLAIAATLPGVRVLDLAAAADRSGEPAPASAHPDDLAYVVFTSGSTGEPKPVAIPHRALNNHAAALAARYRLGAADRVLQFANPTFDVLVEEVFPTLSVGAAVVLLPDALIVPGELERHLAAHEVTVVNLPTPYWTQWTRDLAAAPRPLPPSLRLVVIGSEAGYAQALRTWRQHSDVPVINAYGLSETTVTATTASFDTDLTHLADPLPIGRIIDGGRSYVLDDQLRPVAPGEPGQLYLGGSLLARGYLHRPALTADRFVPDPWGVPGARLYRTGDVVREVDGDLQFLGRDDGQVKIRGHRVEPLEVAAALTGHPEVLQAHVEADHGTDGARLVAYLVPRDDHRVPTAASVRRHLQDRLPHYMVPAVYLVLDALPCLPNGKVDRAGLPPAPRESTAPYVAGRTPLEERLIALWCDVLGLTRLGVNDDLFALGGHSLTATRVAARIHADEGIAISLAEVLAAATVAELAEILTRRGAEPPAQALPVLTGRPRARAPLSRQQEQVWFLHTLAPDSIAYHAQTTIRVAGPLDLDMFDRALTELARRHAILRTSYPQDGAAVWQVVHEPAPVRAARIDLSGVDEVHRAARAEELVRAELHTPFDLRQLPLMRWTVLILGPAEYELVLVEHHLVHDGWSFALLMRELKALYNAYAEGLPSPLPEPTVQYHDFAAWQHDELARGADGVLTAQVEHWRTRLSGMPAPLTLHPDRPRPTVQTYRGETLRIELPPHLPAAVRAFCRSHRVTLFSAMYAAFVALLHRYTGEEDICIGSAYANRQVPGTQDLLGMFVNAVVLRCDVTGATSFSDLAVRARDVVLDAAAHQELPFTELVRELNPHRDAAAHPLTHVLFSVNDSPLPELDLAGATGTIFERGNGSAKTDLDVVVIPRAESQTADAGHIDDRILLLWEYNRDLFEEPTMRAMAERYLRLLEAAVGQPHMAIADLPLVGPAGPAGREDRRGEVDRTSPPRAYAPIAASILGRAEAFPDAVAVEDPGARLTYGQLAGRAGTLAAELVRRGVARGEVVAVLLPRGAELVVAELAVLLVGAAFTPLDVATPAERVAWCCAAARVRFAVTADAWRGLVPRDVEALAIPADAPVARPFGEASAVVPEPAASGDLAYVIYTSGSTGTPKGVMVEHGALANLVGWHLDAFALGPADRVTQFASPAFDVSIGEIWPALVAGATLVVPEDDLRFAPSRLAAWLGAHGITIADLPTAIVDELLAAGTVPEHLRLMLTGGDRLTTRPPAGVPYAVVNAYGPTEAAVTATYAIIGSDGAGLPDIGRPIPGTSAHVLDAQLRPVPPGIPGELYLGGGGLARGYLHRPDLTAHRFVPDPQGSGARLYRTGDLVRRTPSGMLEFLGRVDEQIKLRGHRIEPGEIAAALRADPAIATAHIAMVKGQLVAYLVTLAGAARPDPADLRERLARVLPSYMVPSGYVFLDDALPLTRSGKIDHRRLPPPPAPRSAPARRATGATERALAEIWREVLGVDHVGPDDNFFDLGGHSLLLGRVHQQIVATLRPDLPMVTLFQHPTIGSLARYLDAAGTPASGVRARSDGRDRLRQLRARR